MQSLNFRVISNPVATVLSGVLLFSLLTVPIDFGFTQDANSSDSDTRSIGDYRQDLKAFMKLSKVEDPQAERIAVYNLCQLHAEVVQDSRFDTSQQIQGIRAVIAKRLEQFSKDEKNARLRQDRAAKKNRGQDSLLAERDSNAGEASRESETGDQTSSADEPNGIAVFETAENDNETNSAMYDAAADSYYSIGAASGGPNQLFDYAGRMGPPWDHGQELVDLIVSTIDPAFWRQNGGNGAIHYYQPSLVLVVTAPQQGQEETADLLNRLRQNGDGQMNVGGGFGAIGN